MLSVSRIYYFFNLDLFFSVFFLHPSFSFIHFTDTDPSSFEPHIHHHSLLHKEKILQDASGEKDFFAHLLSTSLHFMRGLEQNAKPNIH